MVGCVKSILRSVKWLIVEVLWVAGYHLLAWESGRIWLLRWKVATAGPGTTYRRDFDVFGDGPVYVGDHVKLVNTFINTVKAEVRIEDTVFFGHNVMLLTGRHNFNLFGLERQAATEGRPILIKQGAWIGSGAIVLGGVTVGDHAVVGAGAVVTRDVEPYVVVAGNPAAVAKRIDHPANTTGQKDTRDE